MCVNEKLDTFFIQEYKPKMCRNRHFDFCPDGVLHKGLSHKKVHELWETSRKIVLLLKDCYTGDDARNYDKTHGVFGKTIASWILGFSKIDEKNTPCLDIDYKAFEDQNNIFAIVNIKKQKGQSSVKDSEIRKYGKLYGSLTREELEILKPNIIICGGKIVFSVLHRNIYKLSNEELKQKEIGCSNNIRVYLFTYQNREFYVVTAYHPSAHMKYSLKYDDLMKAFQHALIKRNIL